MITFAAEPWAVYRRDVGALWDEHFVELAARPDQMAMCPDEAAYRALEASGQLHVLVAREDGRMIGYMTSVVRPHLHYAGTLCGFEDAYFLTKSARRGMTGVRLIKAWIEAMRGRGVKLIFLMTKVLPDLDHSRIFERLGFTRTDYTYALWIGDA